MPNRKLIGVIIDSMDGEYQRTVTENLIRSAISSDVKLLFFGGSAMELPETNMMNNRTIFELVNTRILDGIIVVPSTMVHSYEQDAFGRLLENMKNTPIVSIGMFIEGAYTIAIDNKLAMTQVIEHMMTHYDLKDICFVGGPNNNYDARLRYEAWLELRVANALEFDEKCYFEGVFFQSDGREAVDYFIEVNGSLPKAIVVANDEMAIGAYMRLNELGYHVPEDVGLTGFDNIDRTNDFFPPITTYDQHLGRICNVAIDAISDLLDEKVSSGSLILEGELVLRESCGCMVLPEKGIKKYIRFNEVSSEESKEHIDEAIKALTEDHRDRLLEIISRRVLPSQTNANRSVVFSGRLYEHLIMDLKSVTGGNHFLKCLNSLISYAITSENKHNDLLGLIDDLQSFLIGITDSQLLLDKLKNIAYVSENIINAGIRRQEEHYQHKFRRMYLMSRNVVRELNDVTTNEDIYDILKHSLPYYGISNCYIALYKRPMDFDGIGRFIYPLMSELVFGYECGEAIKSQSFVTNNMLPTQIIYNDDHQHLLMLSLDNGSTQYGYIAFSMDGIDPTIYETIRSQVSEALKRNQMNIKRLEAERALNNVLRELELSNDLLRTQSIHDDLTGLYNRRGFYSQAGAYYNKALERKEPFWIIFGDIDGLKGINDNHGHDEGDYAIRTVADTLAKVLGEVSIVARMSGDEFTALLMNVEEETSAKDYISSIGQQLQEINQNNQKPYEISISLGYSGYDYEELQSMDDLLRQADSNLYREKERKHKG